MSYQIYAYRQDPGTDRCHFIWVLVSTPTITEDISLSELAKISNIEYSLGLKIVNSKSPKEVYYFTTVNPFHPY